jgi:hypothetical protein
MDKNKNIPVGHADGKLRNYSEVAALNRLSDEDSETASELIAGGGESFIDKDINDSPSKGKRK